MRRAHWSIVAKSMHAAPLLVSMRHVMSPWRYHWYLPLPPKAIPAGGSRGIESETGTPTMGLASERGCGVDCTTGCAAVCTDVCIAGCAAGDSVLAAGAGAAAMGVGLESAGVVESASSFASGGSAEVSRGNTSPLVETARLPVWL